MAQQNDDNTPFVRFSDDASWEWYHDYRAIWFYCERALVLRTVEEKTFAFYAHLVEFEWLPLTKAPPDARSTWVRKLYSILPIVCLEGPYLVIRVWGVDIPLNTTTINEVMEVPEVPNLEYKAKRKEMDLEWLRDTIVDPAKWEQLK